MTNEDCPKKPQATTGYNVDLLIPHTSNVSNMYYVYLLESLKDPEKTYVGYTLNLKERLKKHNEGGSIFTAEGRPWKLVTYLAFTKQDKAIAFEQYLKFQSGRAFAKKRLW